jgi:hypothetical protein
MADNAYKRAVANRALAILNAGRTSQSGIFFDSIDDTEFADYTTVSEQNYPDKRLVCALYEGVLKQVIEDIVPDFATKYADLGSRLMVDKEIGGYDYAFELPSDYLALIKQCDEGNPDKGYDCEVLHLRGYSHVVEGTDGNPYYCSADHTSADASRPTTGASYATYWTAMSDTDWPTVTWLTSTAYKYDQTGRVLVTNHLTDTDGLSAYIRYLAYTQAGQSDEPQYYPESFINAFATRLAAEMALDAKDFERRQQLINEYERLAKPRAWQQDNRHRGRVRAKTVFERRLG